MNVFELFASISLDTKPFQNGLSNAVSMASSAGSKVAGGLATIGKMGAAAVGAASAAMGAFAVSAVNAGRDFDSAMSQVAATSGKTMEELANEVGEVDTQWGEFSGNLRDYAQFMGSKTAFSATQAAEALNYMALAGYDAQESMEMLPNVLNLAASGGMELATASDMVTDAQSALGLSAEETTIMVDQMAKTASTTNTSVAQLGEAMLVIGATARNVKGGTAELSQVLGLLADNGIKSAEGGTHLRNMLLSLQNPTKDGAAALEQLGVAVYDAEGNMRALPDIFQEMNKGMEGMSQASKDALTSAIFNKTDLAAANALLGTNAERWDEVALAIAEADGAAGEMAKTQLDNLAGDITLFKSALEGAQIAVSDELTPSLRDFVKFGTDGLSRLTEGFKEGGLTGAMEVFGEVLSDGLAMIVGKVPDFINAGMQLLGALGRGISDNIDEILFAIGDTMEMVFDTMLEATAGGSFVMDVIDAIVGVFAENYASLMDVGFQIITNVINGITEALPDVIHGASAILERFLQYFTENIPDIVQAGFGLVSTLAEGIAEALPDLIPAAVEALLTLVESLIDNVGVLFDASIQIVTALAEGIFTALPVLIERVPEIIGGIVSAFSENKDMMLSSGSEIIVGLIQGISEKIVELVPLAVEAILSFVNGLIGNAGMLIDAALPIIMGLAEGMANVLPVLLEQAPVLISGLVESLMDAVGENLPKFMEAALALVETLIGAVTENLPLLFEAAIQIIESILNGIVENLPMIVEAGIALLMGLVQAILENLPLVIEAAIGLIQALVEAIAGNLPMVIDAAIQIIMAVANGIIENLPLIIDAAIELVTALVEAIADNLPLIIDSAIVILKTVADAIIKNLPLLANAALRIITSLVSGITKNLPKLIKSAFELVSTIAGEIIRNLPNIMAAGVKIVGALVGGILKSLPDVLASGLEIAGAVIKGIIDGLGSLISGVWNAIAEVGRAIMDGFKFILGINSPSTVFYEFAGNIISGLVNGLKEGLTRVKDAIENIVGSIKEKFSTGIENAKTWGKDMMDNFSNGVKNTTSTVKTAVSNAAGKVRKLIGFSEPEEGPLSNFHTYAPDMMRLFAEGIRDNEKLVTDQVRESFNFGDMAVAPSLAVAGGGSAGYDQNALIAAITRAMQGMSVQVMIGQDRIDDMVHKSIQRYNFKSGGR